ncbi:hypothetical protein PSE_2312 [Pseudovibrio sp. FO-BEG1]|uniref:hypothetical protein n=1 Tax=Pseudovibrio sp. (strain FO-BEG1) TaxID=911045 RepID=UPI000238CB58|nr:hypothetical protein [Pseudovibrio sp. FO-BEG1]AEV36822.1 hypothetical protein PSE_2312 [Pseudovibrio sp. FO-BEG1]
MSKKKAFGTCHMCGQEKELCRAHLYPEFLKQYSGTNLKNGDNFLTITVDRKRVTPSQTLEYDQSILCHACDNDVLGTYDTALSLAFKDVQEIISQHQLNPNEKLSCSITHSNEKIALALIANLYRFSISKRCPGFKLAKRWEERFKGWCKARYLPENFDSYVDIRIVAISKHEWSLENILIAEPIISKVTPNVVVIGQLLFGFYAKMTIRELPWPYQSKKEFPRLRKSCSEKIDFPLVSYDELDPNLALIADSIRVLNERPPRKSRPTSR